MKKMVKIVMTLALLLSVLSTGVFAAEDEAVNGQGVSVSRSNADDGIMPLYLYIARFDCEATIEDNNVVCITSVGGYEGITEEIRIEMTLQKKVLFSHFNVETWSDAFRSASAEMVRTYPYQKGTTYRLKSYIEVYHGADFESDSMETADFK